MFLGISIFDKNRYKTIISYLPLIQYCHFGSFPSCNSSSILEIRSPRNKVGIFWNLDNKPSKSTSLYEAAVKLKRAAYAFSFVPPAVKELRNERKELNRVETKGIMKPVELYKCRLCGRVFHTNEKLIGHFKIHEREHQKRLSHIAALKGRNRVNLVGRYALKMEKFKNTSRDVLTPKFGCGFGDILRLPGFRVNTVAARLQAVDTALKNCVMNLMVHGEIQCLVLVSDDSGFVGLLREARERCLKTVVVGDGDEGALKRNADGCFSWREILVGKASPEAVSVLGRLRDRDVLRRLEWSYDPEVEKGCNESAQCSKD